VNRLAGAALIVSLWQATGSAAEPPFTGTFEGTGRACYGGLYVRTKTISWSTPFSACKRVPYEVLERSEKGNERRFTFRLKSSSKACRYGVLYLYHGASANADIDWHVIGYATFEDYKADQQNGFKADSPQALSCSLVTR